MVETSGGLDGDEHKHNTTHTVSRNYNCAMPSMNTSAVATATAAAAAAAAAAVSAAAAAAAATVAKAFCFSCCCRPRSANGHPMVTQWSPNGHCNGHPMVTSYLRGKRYDAYIKEIYYKYIIFFYITLKPFSSQI